MANDARKQSSKSGGDDGARIWLPEAIDDDDPLRGTAYRSIRGLGIGGMSEIFEVEVTTSRKIAIAKGMRDAGRRSARTRDRMRLEWDILHAVHTPKPTANVVRALDAGATRDGRPFIILERLYGHPVEWEA